MGAEDANLDLVKQAVHVLSHPPIEGPSLLQITSVIAIEIHTQVLTQAICVGAQTPTFRSAPEYPHSCSTSDLHWLALGWKSPAHCGCHHCIVSWCHQTLPAGDNLLNAATGRVNLDSGTLPRHRTDALCVSFLPLYKMPQLASSIPTGTFAAVSPSLNVKSPASLQLNPLLCSTRDLLRLK